MKRSMMERRGIRQIVARKLALRFTHNVYKPGCGELHLKSADSTAEFETTDSLKGMAYWPTGGKVVVVSFALPSGERDMYEVSVEEIVEAALRWRKKRAAAMSPAPTSESLPLLPEADDEDVAHGHLGEPGTVQGPLAPPDMPSGE